MTRSGRCTDRRERCTDGIQRRSWRALSHEPLLAVLWLLNIKRNNLPRQAPLTTQMQSTPRVLMITDADGFLAGRKENVHAFQGPFQPSFILPLPQLALVASIITKYAHMAEILLQHCQALRHAHGHVFQPDVPEFFEGTRLPGAHPYLHLHTFM